MGLLGIAEGEREGVESEEPLEIDINRFNGETAR
jgi:hypothetical protein